MGRPGSLDCLPPKQPDVRVHGALAGAETYVSRTQWCLPALVVVGVALLAAGPAAALPGPLGALFADSPAAGCITNAVDNECSDTAPIGGAADVAISPAGAHAYVAASDNSTLIGLATDGVGAPTRAGAACVSSAALVSCSPAIGLGGIASVAVSPDGSHVYTAAPGVSAVAAFVRDPVTGALAQAAAPCVADEIPGVPDPQPSELGCVAVQGLAGAADVAVSPDGSHLYVASSDADAVALLVRDPIGGALTQPVGPARVSRRC